MIFIEIIDQTHIRFLGTDGSSDVVDDATGLAEVAGNNTPIVLFDALHIQCRRFSQKVKDPNILDKVIAAEMTDSLLDDAENYRFDHVVLDGERWVTWIKQPDLAAIKTRFEGISQRVISLTALPLWLAQEASQGVSERPLLYRNQPLFYAMLADETIAMPTAQATNWLTMMQWSDHVVHNVADNVGSNSRLLVADTVKRLPNLWQQRSATTTQQSPWRWWSLLAVAVAGLWAANIYADYHQAKQRVSDLKNRQQQLLKRVFPQAKTADAYGRLASEFQRRPQQQSLTEVQNLLTIFSDTPLQQLMIDVENRRVTLGIKPTKPQINRLKQAGFSVKSTQPNRTEVVW